MKTILVDAVFTFVSETGVINKELHKLLESFPNKKIIVTNAPLEKFEQYGLLDVPYEVFTLSKNPPKTDPEYFKELLEEKNLSADTVAYFEHSLEACNSAESLGIMTHHYDSDKKDLEALKKFLDKNL